MIGNNGGGNDNGMDANGDENGHDDGGNDDADRRCRRRRPLLCPSHAHLGSVIQTSKDNTIQTDHPPSRTINPSHANTGTKHIADTAEYISRLEMSRVPRPVATPRLHWGSLSMWSDRVDFGGGTNQEVPPVSCSVSVTSTIGRNIIKQQSSAPG